MRAKDVKNQRESNSPMAAWLLAEGRHISSAQTILEPQNLSKVARQITKLRIKIGDQMTSSI